MGFPRFPRVPAPTQGDPGWHGHLRRYLKRCALALAVLGAGVAVTATVLIHSLNQAWAKNRIVGLVRSTAGVEIDYRAVRVDLLSGAAVEGIVVRSPLEVRRFAPDLVSLGRVEARWALGDILRGRSPMIPRLSLSNVELSVVVDEHGRTSFDALSSSPSPPPSSPIPLSHLASQLLKTAPPIGELAVDQIRLVLVRTDHGDVTQQTELNGLALELATHKATAPTPGYGVALRLGSSDRPLDLILTHSTRGSQSAVARAKAWFRVDANSTDVRAELDLRMVEQTLLATISAQHWLHTEASLRFDPSSERTQLQIEHTQAGDDAAKLDASIEIPDHGELLVRSAQADVDVARMLRWLPANLVPVSADTARFHAQLDSLVAGPRLSFIGGGTLGIDAELSNVTSPASGSLLHIARGSLKMHAGSAESGATVCQGTVAWDGMHFVSGGVDLTGDRLSIDFNGQRTVDEAVTGRVGIRFARVDLEGTSPALARDGHIEVEVEGLRPNPEQLLATRGHIATTIHLDAFDARLAGTRGSINDLTVTGQTSLKGEAPYEFAVEARAARLRAQGQGGDVLLDSPAHIEALVREFLPVLAEPVASRGIVSASAELGDLQSSIEAEKGTDAVDYSLRASARTLKAIRPFLGPHSADEIPWDRMAAALRSNGRIDHLREDGMLALRQTTELEVDRPGVGTTAARSLSLKVASGGTQWEHQAEIDLRTSGLSIYGGPSRDDHATLSAKADRRKATIHYKLGMEGHVTAQLLGTVSFDPARRAVVFETDSHVTGLGPLAPIVARVHALDGVELSDLDIGLGANGSLLGVVHGIARDGKIAIEPNLAVSAGMEGTADLQMGHMRWAQGDLAIAAPTLKWHGDMALSGTRRTLSSRVDVPSLHIDVGSYDVDLDGMTDESVFAAVGSLTDPEIELSQRLAVGSIAQDILPEYPFGDLTISLSGERTREGVVHVSDLKLANRLGGTEVTAAGNIDLGDGRHSLAASATVTQDLGRLTAIPERFKGRGKVTVTAKVTSPNLGLFDVRSAVKGEDVNVKLPLSGIEVESANGDVPIRVALELGSGGLAFQRNVNRSPYSMLRFADQHPLLSNSGFISIARLKTPIASITPLVGNLAIDQNVVSLQQFEMGVRGGTITGQCALEWEGMKSNLELHVRASGVRSSHGEPFDGNIAVTVSAADRTIEGRAEILRIGERHLLDLLDMQDPLHVDPGMNRIRSALYFGYPESLRLVFDHGFASAHLELGGLARLIRIGELRGIPMGPIVDKMIASMVDGRDTKEAP